MSRLFRALYGRPFAMLWSGQTISLIGDRLFQVALAWWVLEKTGSAVAMGTLLIVTMIPMLLFLLLGGVVVDRFPRLWLMLISDLVRGLVIGLMALLTFTDNLTIGHVYLFSLIIGFVEAFFQPAYRALVPDVTPADDLTSANSLTSLSGQFAGIAGPAAGAAIVAVGGTALAFALDALSFIFSALCLLSIMKQITTRTHAEPSKGILGDLREGIKAVLASPWLWVTIGIAGLSNIAYAGPMEVALPFLIKHDKQADVGLLGLFYALSSVGSIAAALYLGHIRKLKRRGWLLYGSWMLVGIMVVIIGLPVPLLIVLTAALIMGVCNTTLGLVWTNTLQEFVPESLLGRVTSIDYLGSFILLPLGFALGGWGAETIGAPALFVIGGLCQSLLIMLGLLHPKVRAVD